MILDKYWAAKPIEEIASEVEAKFDGYHQWMKTSGYGNRITAVYNTFYGLNDDGTLHIKRDENKIAQLTVSHFKSLVRRLHILITENKLAFSARSRNSDSKSSISADLAKGIVEYYNDEKSMNDTLSESVLGALLMFEYYIYCPWSYAEGFELGVDGGQIIKTGDQKFITRSPFDIAKDTACPESPWYIVREKVNKYDLAAQYPMFESEILADGITAEIDNLLFRHQFSEEDENYIYKYSLFHARTPAMPDGRWTEICANQVLKDSALVYDKVPVFKISAGDVLQTVFKDSPTVELVPLQEVLNALYSGTVTNNLNNSIQLIWSADPNLTTRKLSDGQVLVTSATPPQSLNLTGSSSENYKMIDLLKVDQQLLSGVNDVARGNPSSNLKSGTSLAVILAQAIQYVSHLQKSYARLASDVASCLISNIKAFCPDEMTAYIVGTSKKGQIRKFKARDIMDVERVSVDLGNPLTQTFAGRQELMQTWQQYGVIKDPKQITNFLATGNLDAEIEDEFSDSILITSENEMLRQGIKPVIMITDKHPEHIQKHNKLFSDPLERENPALVKVALEHMMEHVDMMDKIPPRLAAALSGQPLPPKPGEVPNPNEQNPTVEGARMPSTPEGTPPEMADGYQEQLNNMPDDQGAEQL